MPLSLVSLLIIAPSRPTLRLPLVALFCLAFAPSVAPAQYRSDVWTTEKGLPQNSVTAITQTRDGYLWLGTFGGLARFDGVKFTVFDTGNTPGLRSNRIVSLFEDRAGNLWIGTEHGGLTRYAQGRFTTWTTKDGLPDDLVGAITEDQAGALWVSTPRGAARFSEGRFSVFTIGDGSPRADTWLIRATRDGLFDNVVSNIRTMNL